MSNHFILFFFLHENRIIPFPLIYRLGGEVSKVFPDLLLATMDTIHTQYKNLKGRNGYTFNTDEAKEQVQHIVTHIIL